MAIPSIDRNGRIIAATRRITEGRIESFPIPTKTAALRPDPNLTIVRAQIGDRNLSLGIFYDWLFKSNIEPAEFLERHKLFQQQGFRVVLVPFVSHYNRALRDHFDQCRIIRCVELKQPKADAFVSMQYFAVDRTESDQFVTTAANGFSSQIYEQMKRISHIILSDIAAPIYDEAYGKASFGTSCYMKLEDTFLKDQIEQCVRFKAAVELGCGTGRHTFELAKHFAKVDGFDFSNGMIDQAKIRWEKEAETEKDKIEHLHGTEFHTLDVEMFPPSQRNLDLVAGLFGMGSFVEDIETFLWHCHEMLAVNGRILLSFYNKQAAVYVEAPPWRHAALSAEIAGSANELQVRLPGNIEFKVFCRPWTVNEIAEKVGLFFDEVKIVTCPKISAIFPKDYPVAGSGMAAELIAIETDLINAEQYVLGPYILAAGRKPANRFGNMYLPAGLTHGIRALLREGVAYQVNSFFDPKEEYAANVHALLGEWTAAHAAKFPRQFALIKSTKAKAATRRILNAAIGRSDGWELADKDQIVAKFGDKPGDVPVGTFRPSVKVILHGELQNYRKFRLKHGDNVFEIDGLDNLKRLIAQPDTIQVVEERLPVEARSTLQPKKNQPKQTPEVALIGASEQPKRARTRKPKTKPAERGTTK